MISFGLVNEQGDLTNAGALLADESLIRCSRLFCTRWNGLNKSGGAVDALDDAEYSGKGIILPSVDHLYVLSRLLKIHIEDLLVPIQEEIKHPEKVVSVEECGSDVLKIIFRLDNIKIYMSRPSLVEISDTTQMRFDDGEVVTGGSGYGWWWTKEYARREAEEY